MDEAWDQVLTGESLFEDPPKSRQPSRYEQFLDTEEKYIHQDLSNPDVQKAARQALVRIIQETRSKAGTRP